MDWDAVKHEWLNPNRENVYFPLPMLALGVLTAVGWIHIVGGVARVIILEAIS
jgi:hypothetical protein